MDMLERSWEAVGEDLDTQARALGCVSLAIGVTELVAPRQVARMIGIENGEGDHAALLRTLGVREVIHGIDILSHRDPTPGVLSRVAGDILDGVLLGLAGTRTRNVPGFLATCALVLPVLVADLVLADRLRRRRRARGAWLGIGRLRG
jgi:hypothetical protein